MPIVIRMATTGYLGGTSGTITINPGTGAGIIGTGGTSGMLTLTAGTDGLFYPWGGGTIKLGEEKAKPGISRLSANTLIYDTQLGGDEDSPIMMRALVKLVLGQGRQLTYMARLHAITVLEQRLPTVLASLVCAYGANALPFMIPTEPYRKEDWGSTFTIA